MFKEILGNAWPIIEKVAPTIASFLGSPLINISTTFIVSAISKAFGLDPNDVHKLGEAILNDPLAQDKLGTLEETYKSALTKNFNLRFPNDIKVEMHWDNSNDA